MVSGSSFAFSDDDDDDDESSVEEELVELVCDDVEFGSVVF